MSQPSTDCPPEPLFVYGSLKRGGTYHYLLTRHSARFLGTATLPDTYPLLQLDYPCLIDQPGSGAAVHGELYHLPDAAAWACIDALEEHPAVYRRRRIALESSPCGLAWVYFYVLAVPQKINNSL